MDNKHRPSQITAGTLDQDEQVIDISGIPLLTSNVSVLSKGPTFAPKNTANEFKTKVDLFYCNLLREVWYHTTPSVLVTLSYTKQDQHKIKINEHNLSLSLF